MNKLPEAVQAEITNLYTMALMVNSVYVEEVSWSIKQKSAFHYLKMNSVFESVFELEDPNALAYLLKLIRTPMEDALLKKTKSVAESIIKGEVDLFLDEMAPLTVKGIGWIADTKEKKSAIDNLHKAILMSLMARGLYHYVHEHHLIDVVDKELPGAIYSEIKQYTKTNGNLVSV